MTWNDTNQKLTYLTLGILVGYLTPYLITLIKKPSAQSPASD
jgi:hypothetical protein